jgi:hypothetical protein
MKTVAFLLTSMILSVATALDKPASLIRHPQADETRDLGLFNTAFDFLFNADARCQDLLSSSGCDESARLSTKQALADSTEQLVNSLEVDSVVGKELLDIISQSSRADFSPLAEGLRKVTGWGKRFKAMRLRRAVVSKAGSIDLDADVVDIADAVAQLLVAVEDLADVLGQVRQVAGIPTIDLIIFILTSVLGLIVAVPLGPLAIAVFAIRTVIAFLLLFAENATSLILSFRSSDKECMQSLMMCDFNNMVVAIVPELVDEAVLKLS